MIINQAAVLWALFNNKVVSFKVYSACGMVCPRKFPGQTPEVYMKQFTIPLLQELLTSVMI